jgi:hypothetical protein
MRFSDLLDRTAVKELTQAAADLPVGRQSRRSGRHLSRRPQLQMRRIMLPTKRKPVTVGEILNEEFMQPMGLTQAALADIVLNAPNLDSAAHLHVLIFRLVR